MNALSGHLTSLARRQLFSFVLVHLTWIGQIFFNLLATYDLHYFRPDNPLEEITLDIPKKVAG